MNWVKDRYEQVVLAAVAAVLLAMSGMLLLRVRAFNEVFAAIRGEVTKSAELPVAEAEVFTRVQEALAQPRVWEGARAPLFVSRKYIVNADGQLVDPIQPGGPQLHPPVGNEWFEEHGLDILDPNALHDDADGDGFDNLNEWTNKTDPRDKASHAAYISTLRLKKFEQVPFRLVFMARPDNDTFQINVVDVRGQPTQYRKVGEMIEGTKFKVLSFEEKFAEDTYGTRQEVSEVTVENTETGARVVLAKERMANSPDSYALFAFQWNKSEKRVKKDGVFTLEPEPEKHYKLIDITASEAVIESVETGEKLTIPALDAAGA